MNRFLLILLLIMLFWKPGVHGQEMLISTSALNFDGRTLEITYDLSGPRTYKRYYVSALITRSNGDLIDAQGLEGEIGEMIQAGTGKVISWIPSNDSIFLNEKVYVTLSAEPYIHSFNKKNCLMLSAILPGMGQVKAGKNPNLWLGGAGTYGLLAGGTIVYRGYVNSYEAYRLETDPVKRASLLDEAYSKKNISTGLYLTAAAVWAGNMIWMAVLPNPYKPLQGKKLSFTPAVLPGGQPGLVIGLKF